MYMPAYVLDFQEADKTKLGVIGGKGANLGELSKIDGIRVPEGFCVTTEAYKRATGDNRELRGLLDQLSCLDITDTDGIARITEKIRKVIEGIPIPGEITAAITGQLTRLGENSAYAVRSSATAEDLPGASFAGQQDTYLNIIGKDAVLKHISKCWASLFTERAVIYRLQNGFDHNKVQLSAVIQKMLLPEAAGIMFTADPVTYNRKVLSIDASFGLGEALVSGLVTADNYKVREGKITVKTISSKMLEIHGLKEGGTASAPIEGARRNEQTLSDSLILQLEGIGRKIEEHFSCPQDIEWCLSDGEFHILQSRPITALYPLPAEQDDKNHIYMSFGHQQMMTDAMKPLGLSCFEYNSGADGTLIIHAGGRLFMDISHDMATPFGRMLAVAALGKVDPLIGSGMKDLVKRKDFLNSLSRGKRFLSMGSGYFSWALVTQFIKVYRSNDAGVVPALVKVNEAEIKDLEARFSALSGDGLFEAVDTEFKGLLKVIGDPRGLGSVWTGALAVSWVNKNIAEWLGEKGAADTLAQSAPNNVAGEMGLELLDVSDVARQYPAVIEYLKTAKPEGADIFFSNLGKLEGGGAMSIALREFLAKYGIRCSGEIDITRPRWIEEPSALAPLILSNIENFAPGAHKEIFERGLKEAGDKRKEILDRLSAIPGGKVKAKKADRMISRLRNFIGYREYPKYVMVWHYWIVKQALLREAEKLVQRGVFREKEDMYYLSFNELCEAAHTQKFDYNTILERKAAFGAYEKLTPPRLMTSEGEVIRGEYDAGKTPKGALTGIPASSGVVEGRARVVLRLEDAKLSKGDILVTRYTDPSWTPVFVSINGLVAEVGGIMTHGSVVAREYGLPAVVGVENASALIKDGQMIRVNGTEGYVEILK